MGMFSKNRTGLGAYNGEEIIANENYCGETGALQITLEALENQRDMFDVCMEQDFTETAGFLSGAITESSEEFQVMAESAISGFGQKIKEIVKKVWAKIKGLFETFIKKINSVIIRDNKKFVDKYKKEVLTKDLSKMKYKFRDYAEGEDGKYESLIGDAENFIDDSIDELLKASEEGLNKINDRLSDGSYMDDICKGLAGGDKDSFKKDLEEQYFDDEEEEEGLSSQRFTVIMNLLTSKKLVSDIEKDKKAVDKVFSKYLSKLDKAINSLTKTMPNGTASGSVDIGRGAENKVEYDKDNKDITLKRLTTIQKVVTQSQSIFSEITSSAITFKKFEIAQARRVFAKAVSYNPKKVNESAVFVEAAGDAAFYDVMSSFDDYEM